MNRGSFGKGSATRPTEEATYLDLAVHGYSLALLARAVVSVQQDVRAEPDFMLRGERVPLCDLGVLLGATARPCLPFVIVCEADGRAAAFGVDRVGHLSRGGAPQIAAVPAFGLARPEIVAGALRHGERLLVVVSPARLIDLAYELRAGFDPATTRAV